MKKVLALVLSLAMLLTCASFPALAADAPKIVSVTGESVEPDGTGYLLNANGGVIANTIDGNLDTKWYRGWDEAQSTTLILTLSTHTDLTQFQIDWSTTNVDWTNGDCRSNSYTVEVSSTTNGNDWVQVGEITSAPNVATDTFTLSATAVKRIRLKFGADPSGMSSLGIKEFSIVGTASTATIPAAPALAGVTVTPTGYVNASYPLSNMLDGDASTVYWGGYGQQNNATNYDIALSMPTELSSFTIYWGALGYSDAGCIWKPDAGERTYNYKLQYSTTLDGDDFVDIPGAVVNGVPAIKASTDTFNFDTISGVQRVRIAVGEDTPYVEGGYNRSYGLLINDVDFVGTAPATDPGPGAGEVVEAGIVSGVVEENGTTLSPVTHDKNYATKNSWFNIDGKNVTYTFAWTLDKAYDVTEIEVAWTGGSDSIPTDYTILTTTDGSTWNVAKEVTGCTLTNVGNTHEGAANTLAVVDTLTTNNKGVTGIKVAGKNWNGLETYVAEVIVRGTAAGSAPDPEPVVVNYTVNFVDENGDPVATAKTGTITEGETLSIAPVEVAGYTTPALHEVVAGKEDITVTYTYVAIPTDEDPKFVSITGESTYNSDGNNYPLGDVDLTIDGDMNTRWYRGWRRAAETILDLKLNMPTDMTEFSVNWVNDYIDWDTGEERSYNYTVYVSYTDDGEDWVKVGEITATTKKTTDVFTMDEKHVKRVRVHFGTDHDGGLAIKEFTFVGTKNTTGPVVVVDYTVNFVDAEGNPLAQAQTGSIKKDDTLSVAPVEISGYITPALREVVAGDEDIVINYVYQVDNRGVLVGFVSGSDEKGYGLSKTWDGKVSSNVEDGYVDGDWISSTTTKTFIWELDKVYDMRELQVLWTLAWNTASYNGSPADYTIAVSVDGTTYTDVKTVTGLNVDPNTEANKVSTVVDALEGTGNYAKFIRIKAKNWRSGYPAIAEVYFRGHEVQLVDYTINYVDKDGKTIAEPATGVAAVGSTFAPAPAVIEGYAAPAVQSVVVGNEPVVITYVYAKLVGIANSYDYQGSAMPDTYNGNRNDNAYTAEWGNNDAVRSFTWEFDGTYDLTGMEIVWQSGWSQSTYAGGCEEYVVQVSADGKTWVDFHTETGHTESVLGDERLTHAITFSSVAKNIKAVRVIGTKWLSSYPGISEVAFGGTATENPVSENVIYPAKATSSYAASNSTLYAIANMFDGNEDTAFVPSAFTVEEGDGYAPITYTFELDKITDVSAIYMIPAKSVEVEWGTEYTYTRINNYTVSVSADGATWTDVAAVTGGDIRNRRTVNSKTLVEGIAITDMGDVDTSKVKYVRLNITNGSMSALAEVYVTGTATEADLMIGDVPTSVTSNGGQIRPLSDKWSAGIRFGFTVTKAATVTEGVTYGALMIPANLISDYASLSAYVDEFLDTHYYTLSDYITHYQNNAIPDGMVQFLPIVATRNFEETDTTVTFTAVLTGIPETEYRREILAIPFVIDPNGNAYYGDELNRSMYGVAETMKADTDTYNNLTEKERQSVDDVLALANPSYPVQTTLTFEKGGKTYYNVTEANLQGVTLFAEGYDGYYIERGTFSLDAATFTRVIDYPFLGDGAIKFRDWQKGNYDTEYKDKVFDGVLPISKMNDPLYVSMVSPNESENYRGKPGGEYVEGKENNGDTLVHPKSKHQNLVTIGAVYLNDNYADFATANGISVDDLKNITFQIEVTGMATAVKYKGEAWKLHTGPENAESLQKLYPLPWTLQSDNGNINSISSSNRGSTYVKVKLADFLPQSGDPSELVGRVLHFWGTTGTGANSSKTGDQIEGIAAGYKVRLASVSGTDLPASAFNGLFSADTGVDMREKQGDLSWIGGGKSGVDQCFATKSYAITTETRNIIGHNVTPNDYDTVMDSEAVLSLFGMGN